MSAGSSLGPQGSEQTVGAQGLLSPGTPGPPTLTTCKVTGYGGFEKSRPGPKVSSTAGTLNWASVVASGPAAKNPTPFSETLKEGTRLPRAHPLTKQADDAIGRARDQQVPVVIEGCAVDGNGLGVQGELELVTNTKTKNY